MSLPIIPQKAFIFKVLKGKEQVKPALFYYGRGVYC